MSYRIYRTAAYSLAPLFFVVFFLWANLHPSFVLGLLLVALLTLSSLCDLFFLESATPPTLRNVWQRMRSPLLLFLLCLIATLINPYGFGLHESIQHLAGSDYFSRLHEEWRSPDFNDFAPMLALAVLFVIALSHFLAGRVKGGFFEFLSLALFALLSFRAVRIIPFMGIVALVPLSESLTNLQNSPFLKVRPLFGRVARAFPNIERREAGSLRVRYLALFLFVVLIYGVITSSVPLYEGTFGPHRARYPYETVEAIIVQTADSISGGRPGARRDSVENYLKRLQELEALVNAFEGVEKSYALQAGREIRIFVTPEKISDAEAKLMARDIAIKIEQELKYPGEIKVTMIRETRIIEYAR